MFFSLLTPTKCNPPKERNISCGKDIDGKTVPDHEVCIQDQVKTDNLKDRSLAVYRCYNSRGSYKCQNAYSNYCVTDYSMEEPIKDVCPPYFDCVNREFKNGRAKVCIPRMFSGGYGGCSNDFSCGFFLLSQTWATCVNGDCDGFIRKRQ
ncbi:uncharacterized protein [Lepeophtheirus salmonis]|uniref:uncharacterized protein n=1 Tax=Lepeophtheirus salmonis TaxID=72036 RepID=UPI001AE6C13E|nr:uncharacterized protein LOC121123519 isoform X1 [Lepeophtheirus salmonis]